ncbi:MAG: glycosyltransferase family 39 protein [Candidatus Sungiibacteriota bacterium]|uniref:Glycosyltransferase family 39 protein n=1 Tax=Candidatus Sungiibacteriota bacterium TaxID=2750080 RepID=A0A7T5RJE9_9BACT|nr:MAG: glycosyltransferase family 39 protein [Candidatus Sungbacteria bacterium]
MAKTLRYTLVAILIIAALLRFWGISGGDVTNDEVFYAFRAIGLMDFDHAEFQTTPWEWFDPGIPGWAKISFHDHPPLVFLVQHVFIKLLGENPIAFRLPSALLGVASVYLLYLLGTLLFSRSAGLVGAAILAVTVNNVALSRMGLQEPYVIFFMLLTLYFFLKGLRQDRYFLWSGIFLGLGLLTKYNTFILAPILFSYLLFFRRDLIFNKYLWLGGLAAFIFFSPVIFYNFKMYQATGHFDFQFSYILDQDVPEWHDAPGKKIGTLAERVKDFLPFIFYTNSWSTLLLFGASFPAFLGALLKKSKETWQKFAVPLLFLFWLIVLIVGFIGLSFRFVSMLTPFMALFLAVPLSRIIKGIRERFRVSVTAVAGAVVLLLLFLFEIFYSVNSQLIEYPRGPQNLLWSSIRYENYNWGYDDLGRYFKKEFEGRMPAFVFDMQYKFLEELRDRVLKKEAARDQARYPAVIIHYGNLDDGAKLWNLDRLMTYHGWPVLSLKDYFLLQKEKGSDFFIKSGFKYYYFVWQTNIVVGEEFRSLVEGGTPNVITNKRGDRAFVVYKKVLEGK